MKLNEQIYQFIDRSTPVKQASTLLLINHFKEKGYSEEEVLVAIEQLQRKGETYKLPETLCLIKAKRR